MSPLEVEVALGEYFTSQAYFAGDMKVDVSAMKFPEMVTRYKRVRI
jgi:hypothetical protein